MRFSNNMVFTGLAADDRRIARDLMAMGAFDQVQEEQPSLFSRQIKTVQSFITWMRWKGEISVYGCRIGVDRETRRLEAVSA